MEQTLLTATFTVQASSAKLLEKCITEFRNAPNAAGETRYAELKRAVPALHFMALMVFHDRHYDPLFLLEVNFDGPEPAFWRQLEATIGPDLIAMLRFCAPPRRTGHKQRFEAMQRTGQGLADVLHDAATRPTASHLGNRGLTRDRIEAEQTLFQRLQSELRAHDATFRALTPPQIHATLRSRLAREHPWLDTPAPARIPDHESRADWIDLALFASLAFAVLAVPGAVLSLVLPPWFAALLGVGAAILLRPRVEGLAELVPALSWPKLLAVLAAIVLLVLPWLLAGAFVLWLLAGLALLLQGGMPVGAGPWMLASVYKALAGVVWIPALLLLVLAWLRTIEDGDSTQTSPARNDDALQRMHEREDLGAQVRQNHMGSIVLVKPGVLRSLLLPLGHRALHLILRVTARDGFLSDMRTVHFAHWALLNNRSRLLFLSNFDGTWDSYLDDFIEKANGGTTLAWTNGVGAPLARFLLLDGVRKGRQFKAWARQSMAPNLFWFSAYPSLTVDQIERNHTIAEGLRKPSLDATEAVRWARAL